MVDQALAVYLEKKFTSPKKTSTNGKASERLNSLLSWEDTECDFSTQEIEVIIEAIDHLNALDPACGSGAFPMGLLQKLVHVLRKLDPKTNAGVAVRKKHWTLSKVPRRATRRGKPSSARLRAITTTTGENST